MNTNNWAESFPVPLVHLEETDSTLNYLRNLCKSEHPEELTTVVADYQTAGRGQRGNTWESEPGKNLLLSFVMYPGFIKAKEQFVLSQLVALTIKETLDCYTEGIRIKWPNDIYWKTRKLGGILIENDLQDNAVGTCFVGFGLNVNQQSFAGDAPNPVSLRQITGKETDPLNLAACIMSRFRTGYEALREGNREELATRYEKALFRREGMHRYCDRNGMFRARITKVEPCGALVLTDEQGTERSYLFKEVEYVLKDQ